MGRLGTARNDRLSAFIAASNTPKRGDDMLITNRYYKITPRPEHLGGGWRLTLYEDGEEMGFGAFPAGEEGYKAAIAEGDAWELEAALPDRTPVSRSKSG